MSNFIIGNIIWIPSIIMFLFFPENSLTVNDPILRRNDSSNNTK
jgi:hypothetical protein